MCHEEGLGLILQIHLISGTLPPCIGSTVGLSPHLGPGLDAHALAQLGVLHQITRDLGCGCVVARRVQVPCTVYGTSSDHMLGVICAHCDALSRTLQTSELHIIC